MNLVRRILEGINEVELEITPEFQAPGIGEPEVARGLNRGDVTWTWFLGRGKDDSIEGEFFRHRLTIDASISTMFGGWNPWHVVRQAFEWVKNHLSDYTSKKVGIHLVKVNPDKIVHHEREYAERLQREGIIDGFTMVGEGEPEVEPKHKEGSFEKPKVSSDDKGITWWDFGRLLFGGRVYPPQKRVDVLGPVSSVDARMDELMKMFSWLRDEYRGYYITVYGGNAKREDMADLVNAGMINKFVSEG